MEKKNAKIIKRVLIGIFIIAVLLYGANYIMVNYIYKNTNTNVDRSSEAMDKNYPKKAFKILEKGLYANNDEFKKSKDMLLEKMKKAKTYGEADSVLLEAAKIAGGKHSFIQTKSMADSKKIENTLPQINLENEILIIKMGGVMNDKSFMQKYADTINDAIASNKYKGIIIDASYNHGGDMGPMLQGISSLIPEGDIVTFKSNDGTIGKVYKKDGQIFGGGTQIKLTNKSQFIQPKVAVIISKDNGSSGEQLVLALKGLSNVKVFGEETAGYTSVNQNFNLESGSTLYLSVGYTVDRYGNEFKDSKVSPDEKVSLDKAIDTAKTWIIK